MRRLPQFRQCLHEFEVLGTGLRSVLFRLIKNGNQRGARRRVTQHPRRYLVAQAVAKTHMKIARYKAALVNIAAMDCTALALIMGTQLFQTPA